MKRYQYENGAYLPESSQPEHEGNFKIKGLQYTPHTSVRYRNVVMGENGVAMIKEASGEYRQTDKKLPVLYERRESCCGCAACCAVCRGGVIEMQPDEEGFLYPVVNAQACIRCYRCLDVCAFREAQKDK